MLGYIFASVLEISVAISILITFLLLLPQKLFDKYSPKFRTRLWLIIALRLLLPIQPRFGVAAVRLEAPYHIGAAVSDGTVSMMQILSAVWIVGAIAFFLWHILGFYLFKQRIDSGCDIAEISVKEKTAIRNTFYDVKYKLGIYDLIELCISAEADEPMLMGFIKPKLVLPDSCFDKEMLEMIFCHELLHYCRRDSWYRLIMLFAKSLYWFDPMVYMMARRAADDLEAACDRSVIDKREGEFVQSYAGTLIETARCMVIKRRSNILSSGLLAGHSGKQKLKRRLEGLFCSGNKKGIPLLISVAMLTFLCSGLIFIQSNDKTLDWAVNLSTGDISSVIVSDNVCSHEYSSQEIKDDIVNWFENSGFKPSFYKSRHRTEDERYCINQTDGSKNTVAVFSDGNVSVNGREYRAYKWKAR